MPATGRTPLARLHDTAMQLGIIVVDAADGDGPLLDDDTAAFVACGVCIALNPGLDDGLRADVLAMALALTYAMSPGTTDHAGDITAAAGFALISRAREAKPRSALGSLATEIAREHGRDTASAAFEYTVPVLELAQRPAGSAPLATAGTALARKPHVMRTGMSVGLLKATGPPVSGSASRSFHPIGHDSSCRHSLTCGAASQHVPDAVPGAVGADRSRVGDCLVDELLSAARGAGHGRGKVVEPLDHVGAGRLEFCRYRGVRVWMRTHMRDCRCDGRRLVLDDMEYDVRA
jgi:hypothetical protein